MPLQFLRTTRSRFLRAFTLLEVIIVIALIALASGIAVSNMGDLVPALEKPSVEKSLERACNFAAHSAWTKKKKFYVCNLPDEKKIVVENSRGDRLETFDNETGTLSASFFSDPRDGTKIFLTTQLNEIFKIEFNPAGCATPAVIILKRDGKTEKIFQLDPFSGGLEERNTL